MISKITSHNSIVFIIFNPVEKKTSSDSLTSSKIAKEETGTTYDIKEMKPEINFIDDFNKECSFIENTSFNDSNFVDDHRKDDLIICISNLDLSGNNPDKHFGKKFKKILLPKNNSIKSIDINNRLNNIDSKMIRVKKYLYAIIALGIISLVVIILFRLNIL